MSIQRKAIAGEYVRYKGMPGTQFNVIYVTDNIVKGEMYCDEIRHGDYEIVVRKLIPWTIIDAVRSFAKQGTMFVDGRYYRLIVSSIEVGCVGWKTGGSSTYGQLANDFKMTDGSPCGSEEWEVVG